jgi:ribosomal protein L11 methylase PrmA
MNPQENRQPSSFRDPSGFMFERDGTLYRQVNQRYREDYEYLLSSGLYQSLVESELIIPHIEVAEQPYSVSDSYKIIQPDRIAFISYPYEWSFSAFRDAAKATLHIQHLALQHGMILKDASAYNIQFHNGKPTLIDSLSFQRWEDGRPWDGYRQFCQHFLAPLALMAYKDIRLSRLLAFFLDGIPLDLASRILPRRTYLKLPLLTHIHIHSRMQISAATRAPQRTDMTVRKVTKNSLLGMTENLQRGIDILRWDPGKTRWADYYETFSYGEDAITFKEAFVRQFISLVEPKVIWDIGANTGRFSRIASDQGIFTIAMDFDAGAVDANYQLAKSNAESSIQPLVIDLTNPSPNLGWRLSERSSLLDRGPVDAILALALVHHLAIGNNLPFSEIASFFADLGKWLLIEFVPKDDVQVQQMLSVREDIFDSYTQEAFEAEFTKRYEIIRTETVKGSSRMLYMMKSRII